VGAYVSPTRDMVYARKFFERAIVSSGITPHRVITDKAATYPPALASAVSRAGAAIHRPAVVVTFSDTRFTRVKCDPNAQRCDRGPKFRD
jgi:transposase-like protein